MKRQRINLIPLELRPKRKIPHEILPLGFLVMLVLYSAGSIVSVTWLTQYRRTELRELTDASQALSAKVKVLSEQSLQTEQNDRAMLAIQKVVGRKNYWSEVFKELTMLMPDGIWITHFADSKSKDADAKDKEKKESLLSLVGESDSQEVVAEFLTILEKSHHFAGVQLKFSEKETGVQPARYKFEFKVPVKVMTSGSGT